MARPIRIYTLGTFRIEAHGRPIPLSLKANNRPLLLLKVLVALGAQDVTVDSLCEHLWPDADGDHAIDAFNTTLLRLRRRIGREALRLAGGRLCLDPRAAWLDASEVRRLLVRAAVAVRAGDADRAVTALQAVLIHYRGPLLQGEYAPALIEAERERLQDQVIRQMDATAALLDDAGRRDEAIALCRRGIDLHPTAEMLHRQLMRCCLATGRHAEGIEAYHRCRAALHLHLTAEPAQETRDLYTSLQAAARFGVPGSAEPAVRVDAALKASIAVAPFKDLTVGHQLQPVIDGLAEDLMTALARTTLLGVVSQTIAARGDARMETLQALSRECAIPYLLNGSVQQSGSRVRVHVRLLDTQSGRDMWGERFDGHVERLFELQDEIARCVVDEVDRLLFSGEHFLGARHSTRHPEAARLFLQATKDAFRRSDPAGTERALRTVERALALDPDMACAEVVKANLHMEAVETGWSANSRRELDQARASIERAITRRPDLGMVHACRARMLTMRGEYDEALAAAERGVACEAGRPDLTFHLARTQLLAGDLERAVGHAERAMRMSVRREPKQLSVVGAAYLMAGRPAEGLRWLTRAASLLATNPVVRLWQAAAHGALGQREQARGVASDLRELAPWFDADYWARRGMAFRREGDRQRLLDWLHAAGIVTSRTSTRPRSTARSAPS